MSSFQLKSLPRRSGPSGSNTNIAKHHPGHVGSIHNISEGLGNRQHLNLSSQTPNRSMGSIDGIHKSVDVLAAMNGKKLNTHSMAGTKQFNATPNIVPLFTKEFTSPVFSAKFSPDGAFAAAALEDGSIAVCRTKPDDEPTFLKLAEDRPLPVTCVSFRPANNAYKDQSVLAAACKFIFYSLPVQTSFTHHETF